MQKYLTTWCAARIEELIRHRRPHHLHRVGLPPCGHLSRCCWLPISQSPVASCPLPAGPCPLTVDVLPDQLAGCSNWWVTVFRVVVLLATHFAYCRSLCKINQNRKRILCSTRKLRFTARSSGTASREGSSALGATQFTLPLSLSFLSNLPLEIQANYQEDTPNCRQRDSPRQSRLGRLVNTCQLFVCAIGVFLHKATKWNVNTNEICTILTPT